MKKTILGVFLLFAALSAGAQGKHEINVFVGGYKSEFFHEDDSRSYYGDLLFDATDNIHRGDLADLYEPHYNIKSSPVLTVNYHYILNRWVRLGAQMNWAGLSGEYRYLLSSRAPEKFSQRAPGISAFMASWQPVCSLTWVRSTAVPVPWSSPGTWFPSARNGAAGVSTATPNSATAALSRAAVSA